MYYSGTCTQCTIPITYTIFEGGKLLNSGEKQHIEAFAQQSSKTYLLYSLFNIIDRWFQIKFSNYSSIKLHINKKNIQLSP